MAVAGQALRLALRVMPWPSLSLPNFLSRHNNAKLVYMQASMPCHPRQAFPTASLWLYVPLKLREVTASYSTEHTSLRSAALESVVLTLHAKCQSLLDIGRGNLDAEGRRWHFSFGKRYRRLACATRLNASCASSGVLLLEFVAFFSLRLGPKLSLLLVRLTALQRECSAHTLV